MTTTRLFLALLLVQRLHDILPSSVSGGTDDSDLFGGASVSRALSDLTTKSAWLTKDVKPTYSTTESSDLVPHTSQAHAGGSMLSQTPAKTSTLNLEKSDQEERNLQSDGRGLLLFSQGSNKGKGRSAKGKGKGYVSKGKGFDVKGVSPSACLDTELSEGQGLDLFSEDNDEKWYSEREKGMRSKGKGSNTKGVNPSVCKHPKVSKGKGLVLFSPGSKGKGHLAKGNMATHVICLHPKMSKWKTLLMHHYKGKGFASKGKGVWACHYLPNEIPKTNSAPPTTSVPSTTVGPSSVAQQGAIAPLLPAVIPINSQTDMVHPDTSPHGAADSPSSMAVSSTSLAPLAGSLVSSPPMSPTSGPYVVPASPFAAIFVVTIDDDVNPTVEEFAAATKLTSIHVEQYLAHVIASANLELWYIGQAPVPTKTTSPVPVSIEFDFTARFGNNNKNNNNNIDFSILPTTAQLDQWVQESLSSPAVDVLIEAVRRLSGSNPLSLTVTISYTKIDDDDVGDDDVLLQPRNSVAVPSSSPTETQLPSTAAVTPSLQPLMLPPPTTVVAKTSSSPMQEPVSEQQQQGAFPKRIGSSLFVISIVIGITGTVVAFIVGYRSLQLRQQPQQKR